MERETTPILLLKGQKVFRLLNITYENDDSIYITFPRKQGYLLNRISEKEYDKSNGIATITRTLDDIEEEYFCTKISFHPRNNTVHIKSSDGKRVSNTYKLCNFSEDKNFFFTYFVQIIFPNNYEIFDEYKKTKYKDKLEIPYDIVDNNETISLEVFIHPQNSTICDDALPFSKNRTLKFMRSYFGNKKYSCSFAVSTLPCDHNTSNIIVSVNTETHSVIYSLEPQENSFKLN